MITATQGHCSQCHKIWTLDKGEGICPWCGRTAIRRTLRTNPRPLKSSSRRRPKQAKAHGNGYDQLDGQWLAYYQVANKYAHKALAEDREDLLHNIMLTLAQAQTAKDSNGGGQLSDFAMLRIASHTTANYWRQRYRMTNGLDCGNCSRAQRAKCRQGWLYPECPRGKRIESLSKPVVNEDGNMTELGELIADDKAIDLDQWLDAKTWLLGCPSRLVEIAHKLADGSRLTATDSRYLYKFRKKSQKSLC